GGGRRARAAAARKSAACARRAERRSCFRTQQIEQLSERQAAVADAILFIRRKFRRRLCRSLRQEQRVVSESSFAARKARNAAVPFSARDERARIARAA